MSTAHTDAVAITDVKMPLTDIDNHNLSVYNVITFGKRTCSENADTFQRYLFKSFTSQTIQSQ